MNKNINKKNKIIQKLISQIIRELIFVEHDNLITITYVNTSADGLKSNIYISSLKNEKEIINVLNKYNKKIKNELSKKIKNSKIPELEFHIDNNIEYETIFKKINIIQNLKK